VTSKVFLEVVVEKTVTKTRCGFGNAVAEKLEFVYCSSPLSDRKTAVPDQNGEDDF
jgi:hypothetical protein